MLLVVLVLLQVPGLRVRRVLVQPAVPLGPLGRPGPVLLVLRVPLVRQDRRGLLEPESPVRAAHQALLVQRVLVPQVHPVLMVRDQHLTPVLVPLPLNLYRLRARAHQVRLGRMTQQLVLVPPELLVPLALPGLALFPPVLLLPGRAREQQMSRIILPLPQ